jgi:hypothetical protein
MDKGCRVGDPRPLLPAVAQNSYPEVKAEGRMENAEKK